VRTEIAVSCAGAKYAQAAKETVDFTLRSFAALRLCVSCVHASSIPPKTIRPGRPPGHTWRSLVSCLIHEPANLRSRPSTACVSLTALGCYVTLKA
jgi:hypothetical protein